MSMCMLSYHSIYHRFAETKSIVERSRVLFFSIHLMLRKRLRHHIYRASNVFLSILITTIEFHIYTQRYGLCKYFDQFFLDINIVYM